MAFAPQYTALPTPSSIRLLKIIPDEFAATLRCSLEVISNYNEAPEYHCISYCWGDPKDLVEVICNASSVFITRSLNAALCQLRADGQSKHIWADALSIDQSNIEERNQQVSIMTKIFEHCSRVLVWLGPKDDSTVDALEMIQRIADRTFADCAPGMSMSDWIDSWHIDSAQLRRISERSTIHANDFPIAKWQALWKFLRAPWFSRIWVIQEVRQRRKVLVLSGDLTIARDLICVTASLGQFPPQDLWSHGGNAALKGSRNSCFNIGIMRDQWTELEHVVSFPVILSAIKHFRATDPRDRVFALLQYRLEQFPRPASEEDAREAISPSDGTRITHLGMQADYHMTLYDVYREVSIRCFQDYSRSQILTYTWQTAHVDNLWPSWIRRWDIPCATELAPVLHADSDFDAARGSSFTYSSDSGSDTLLTQCIRIGSVAKIGPVWDFRQTTRGPSGTHDGDLGGSLSQFWTMCRLDFSNIQDLHLSDLAKYIVECIDTRLTDCWIPLYSFGCDQCGQVVGTVDREVFDGPLHMYHCRQCADDDYDICSTCYENYEKRCVDNTHEMHMERVPGLWVPATADFRRILEDCLHLQTEPTMSRGVFGVYRYLSFFQMDTDVCGTCSSFAKTGDAVAIILGSKVPFIVRQFGEVCRLISSCYVPGFMHGEAVEKAMTGELRIEELAIR